VYRKLSVIAIAPAYDEERRIGEVVRRVPRDVVDEVLVVDDGSHDTTPDVARDAGATVVSLGRTIGVGAALRMGYAYAVDHGYDIAVVMAGNNKDAPEEIPLLLDPLAAGSADFVQGSRFLKKDPSFGSMPMYRRLATRIHPLLFSLAAGKRVSESTNGFRALRTTILKDDRIDLTDPRLDGYELEPYLYLRVLGLGYRTTEVPVTKTYAPRNLGKQTKMRPVTDWWAILRPLVWGLAGRLRNSRSRRRDDRERDGRQGAHP